MSSSDTALATALPASPLAPAPPRRIRPWLALRAFLRALRNPDDTENGARFVLALDGDRSEETFQRFARSEVGARVLADGRCLETLLSDRAHLRSLPAGSLGRTYLAFVEEEKISAEGLARAVAPVEAELGAQDEARQAHARRMRAMHDLWHVLTGYSRDLLGELQLLAFSYEQLHTRAFALMVPMAGFFNERQAPGTRRLIALARERGRAARWLPAEDWEALLAEPLADVREKLGVGPPPAYVRYFRSEKGFRLVPEQEPYTTLA